jgi:hypothetical protein
MLSSRSDRTHSGKKLSVEVSYPRGFVMARTVRTLALKGALVGGMLGFAHASYTHSSGQRPERGKAALIAVAGETAIWTATGAAAGLSGSLAYALVGGPVGAMLGVTGAALVGGGTFAALPSVAALPSQVGERAQVALGYVPSGGVSNYTLTSFDSEIKEDAPPPAPKFSGPWNDKIVFFGHESRPDQQSRALDERARRFDHDFARQGAGSHSRRQQHLRSAKCARHFRICVNFGASSQSSSGNAPRFRDL